MRFKELTVFEATFDNVRREEGEVVFPSSTIKDPHVQKAIKSIAKQTKTSVKKVTATVEGKLASLEGMAEDSPILYETINKNAAEQAVFEIFWRANLKSEGAPEFDNVVFKQLINQLRVEYDEFFPLRSYIDKRKLTRPVIRIVEADSKIGKEIKTAAASPKGEFFFNREFMQALINYAHLKDIQPTANKYTNNGGKFPPEYAYVEFIIMHEFMHYSNDDFYYQKVIPNANPTIINWVGDFRTNYQLVKSGFEGLPMGLFNDKINYDRQDEYVEMYDLVKDEMERLKPKDQLILEKLMDDLADDHQRGNDDGEKMPGPGEGEGGEGEGGEGGEGDLQVGDKVVINDTGTEGTISQVIKDSDGNVVDVVVDEDMGFVSESMIRRPASGVTKISSGGSGKGKVRRPARPGDEDGDEVTIGDLEGQAKANGDAVDGDKKKNPGHVTGEVGDGNDEMPWSDIRGFSSDEGKKGGKGHKPKELDYKKINPQFNWKTLVQRFIKSGLGRSETTYAKPHRRSVTGIDIARQTGAGAIKPAERPIEFNDAKIMFVIDNSGSMGWVITEIIAEAFKLLKMPAFKKSVILVSKFSSGANLFKCNIPQDKAGEVDSPKDMPKKWDKKASNVLGSTTGGGTEVTPEMTADVIAAMQLGYNAIFMTDSDILWGHNLPELLKMIKANPKQFFLVFDTSSSYIAFRQKTGITSPNITFFKDER